MEFRLLVMRCVSLRSGNVRGSVFDVKRVRSIGVTDSGFPAAKIRCIKWLESSFHLA